MMQLKPLRTVTADCRAINIGELSKLGAFKRPTNLALRGIETHRDFIKLRSPRNPNREPQIILIDWRRITYGMKAHFICPRCQSRRAILYFDGLQAYCRVCADLHRSGKDAAPDCGSRLTSSAPHSAMKMGSPAILGQPSPSACRARSPT